MWRRLFTFLAFAPALVRAEALPWSDLPEAPGRELTYGLCSGCHSMQIVMQQGMTREQWDETLDWMVEEQGMGELTGAPREQVLDYLAQVFSPEQPYFHPSD